jgi:hypothetical protein
MADFTLHLLAAELDKKRKQVEKSLASPTLKGPARIRLEGMQAGLVWARMLVQEIAETADKAQEAVHGRQTH